MTAVGCLQFVDTNIEFICTMMNNWEYLNKDQFIFLSGTVTGLLKFIHKATKLKLESLSILDDLNGILCNLLNMIVLKLESF